jgi:transcriptional antiterminator RfaH
MMTGKLSPFTKSMSENERFWFAIKVRPKCEKLVRDRLLDKGVPNYVPIQIKVRHYTRKVKKVELPLLKGYVLVNAILEDYLPIIGTEHVLGFLRSDRAPAVIPEKDIELLRRVEGSAHAANSIPLNELQAGAMLEIIGGDLTGMTGRMVSIKGKELISVELIHLDTAILLDIDKKYLRLL